MDSPGDGSGPDRRSGGVDRRSPAALEGLLASLPEAHAALLRGLAAGESDAALAEEAGIDPTALPAFVRVALAKLLDQRDDAESA